MYDVDLTPTLLFFSGGRGLLGKRLLDDCAIAVARVRQLDATPRRLHRKEVNVFCERTIVMGGLGVSGPDVNEHAKLIIEGVQNSIQVYEGLSCFGAAGPQLE